MPMTEMLTPGLPAGITLPEPLTRAWAWMEARGFGFTNEHGYFLTPYPGDRQLGVVFTPAESLTGWFEPGEPGHDDLVPLGQIAGDGSLCALWNDSGTVRFVALGSDGAAFLLADSAVDFLRLIAIGYDEIPYPEYLAEPPEDEDTVEAHAPFRTWVEAEFGVEVPGRWRTAAPDPFDAWIEDSGA
ncbi:hypothetical protein [Nocardiopsis lucentensis]|uniref:hypothetical protein n=1 Tax=Nocardiopsis lucentensis TaxID=53441 RepID=UPI000362DA03|nr:hypothetical protein [Nocardiopsis lucentensis]